MKLKKSPRIMHCYPCNKMSYFRLTWIDRKALLTFWKCNICNYTIKEEMQ
jgi:transcription elongation factor Elf1